MDEHTLEKLKVLGYANPPKELQELITGFKRRIDSIDPRPLTLEALVTCIALYEVFIKTRKAS
jgi:hypothetical protein